MEWDELIRIWIIVCPLVFLGGLIDAVAGGGGLITPVSYTHLDVYKRQPQLRDLRSAQWKGQAPRGLCGAAAGGAGQAAPGA